jgi:hypothetical protein
MIGLTENQTHAARRAVALHCNAWERMNQWRFNMVERQDQGLRALAIVAQEAAGIGPAEMIGSPPIGLGIIIGEVVAAREELNAAIHRANGVRIVPTGERTEARYGVRAEADRRRDAVAKRWEAMVLTGQAESVRIG